MRALIPILILISAPTFAKPATIDDTLHNYVIGFLLRNPTVNTYLGGAGLDPSLKAADGRLRDFSAAAIAKEDAWLRGVEKTLASYADLTPRQRIDRDVALAQIRFQLHLH